MFQGFITLHKVIAEGKNAIFFRFYMFIRKSDIKVIIPTVG